VAHFAQLDEIILEQDAVAKQFSNFRELIFSSIGHRVLSALRNRGSRGSAKQSRRHLRRRSMVARPGQIDLLALMTH
jgi:hypothetical protein